MDDPHVKWGHGKLDGPFGVAGVNGRHFMWGHGEFASAFRVAGIDAPHIWGRVSLSARRVWHETAHVLWSHGKLVRTSGQGPFSVAGINAHTSRGAKVSLAARYAWQENGPHVPWGHGKFADTFRVAEGKDPHVGRGHGKFISAFGVSRVAAHTSCGVAVSLSER